MPVTYRTIWQTAYPILLSLLVEQFIGITDTAFLGHLGEVELAASALAGVCYLILYVMFSSYFITVPAFVLYYTVSGTGNTFSSLIIGLLSLTVYCIYIVMVGKDGSSLLWLWASEHMYALSILILSAIYLWRFDWRRKIV